MVLAKSLGMPKYTATIPTYVTIGRSILALVGVVWFAFEPRLVAVILIVVGMWLDILDGFLARRLNQHSDFGRWLDPVLDKAVLFLCMMVLLCYVVVREQWLMLFVAFGILVCDVSIAVTSAKKEASGVVIKPTKNGKHGMFLRNSSLFLMMTAQVVGKGDGQLLLGWTATFCGAVGIAFGLFALDDYRRAI